MKNKGFTLIELIIVIVLIGLLSAISIQSFVDYNKKQQLDAAAADLVTMLQTARSRALSQVKPTTWLCDDEVLSGYRVEVYDTGSNDNPKFALFAVCQGSSLNLIKVGQKVLPYAFSFSKLYGNDWFQFQVLTGAVTYESYPLPDSNPPPYTQFWYSGRYREITVFPDGRITSK